MDAGRVVVRVLLGADGRISEAGVHSARPPAARLLRGRPAGQALALAGLLFQACREAQTAAAAAALGAAGWQDQRPERGAAAEREARVACEVAQEHLWRLMLDWPALLALPADQQGFRRWFQALRAAAAAGRLPQGLLAEFEQHWLGCAAARWQQFATLEQLDRWCAGHDSPAAQLCTAMAGHDSDPLAPAPAPLLRDQSLATLAAGWGEDIDDDFCQLPHRDGVACETGVLSWQGDTPLQQDLGARRPARLLARLLARVQDLLEILGGVARQRIEAVRCADGSGMALVRTARGLLLHRVQLAADQVAAYRSVAPTEWNFHPQGPLVRALRGLRVGGDGQRACPVRLQLATLDPCVEHVLEVGHA